MELIADILLIFGAIAAAFYCVVLSKRLQKFTDLEKGVGGAIAVLSSQVDDMTKTLGKAQEAASGSNVSLELLTERAEEVANRLELLVASMHDIPHSDPSPSISHSDKANEIDGDTGFKSARSNTSQAA